MGDSDLKIKGCQTFALMWLTFQNHTADAYIWPQVLLVHKPRISNLVELPDHILS